MTQAGRRSPRRTTPPGEAPPVEVQVDVRDVRVPGGRPALTAFLEALGAEASRTSGRPVVLAFVLVDDATIREVNARMLGHDWATDVITFPWGQAPALEAELMLSVETARREAAERGHDPADELALYAVHGVLHLLGHDDHDPAARRRMRSAERRWLERLGRPAVFGRRT
ncbi:MAG: rRNA maturation RNase YbeY [Planctomycetota bacterium]